MTRGAAVEQQLRAQVGALGALVVASSPEEVARGVLAALGRALGWDEGALWLASGDRLQYVDGWRREDVGTDLEAVTRARTFARGEPVPGEVWATGRPAWIDDVSTAAVFARRDAAGRADLHAGCWFPIIAPSGATGVVELLGRTPHASDRALLEALAAIGREIGRFLERLDTERHLREAAERAHLLLAGIRDHGVVLLDPKGRVVAWNAGAERLQGWSGAEMVGANCDRLFLPEDVAAGTRGGALDVAARAGRFEAESWRVRRDGTRFWANAVLSAVRAADGALAGFAEVTTDFTERRRFEEELASARERLRVLAQRLASVGEEEKARLAREIHDVLGGELTGLKLDAAWILRRLPRLKGPECGAVAERLASMMSQLDATVQTVRRIATGLRPQMLDDLGLPATVEWQALEFQERSGLEVAVMVPEAPTPIVPERGTALFRIFQELLTNIARHAGARRVRVKLTFERGEAVLAVEDDGRGVTDAEGASPRSLGIVGMRERAALFGGSLDIAGASGKGTRALLRIPLGHG